MLNLLCVDLEWNRTGFAVFYMSVCLEVLTLWKIVDRFESGFTDRFSRAQSIKVY